MDASFNEINNIVKTLPLGYYANRKLDLTLDEHSNVSFFNPMNDSITISYQMLNDMLKRVPDDHDIEESVRTLVYHEVSHAILTPKNVTMTDIINIFEDERIETLLASFYMKVDFKKFVKLVNNFNYEKPSSAQEEFYQVVRYRFGKQEFVKRVEEIIENFKSINHLTETYDWHTYCYQIRSLYSDIERDWLSNNQPEQSNGDSSQNNDSNSTDQNNSQSTEKTDEQSQESSQASTNSCSTSSDEQSSEIASQIERAKQSEENTKNMFDSDFAKDLLQQVVDVYHSSEMTERISQILSKAANSSKRNAGAINSYSGVFDPRSVIRQDCKYFVQKNRNGHVKAFSKIHLNMFIDRSGSFRSSEEIANKLLYALTQFERQNPDFTFDLITMGKGVRLESRTNRELKCSGGNYLYDDTFDIYKKVQLQGCTNFNIVLFDGDAFSCGFGCGTRSKDIKNIGAFNHSNCMIISDDDNASYLEKHCKSAKVIITKDYVDKLVENTMTALQTLTR